MRKAFSLIELLVVLAVIGILAALLLPGLAKAQAEGRRARCIGNLRQIALGLTTYVLDSRAYPPFGPWPASDRTTLWDYRLMPYAPNPEVFRCPSCKLEDNWTHTRQPLFGPLIAYPNLSYSYNGFGCANEPVNYFPSLGLSPPNRFWDSWPSVKDSAVRNPSDMISLCDADILRDDDGDGDNHPDLPWGITLYAAHKPLAEVAFCDGHTEAGRPNLLRAQWWRWNIDNSITNSAKGHP